MLNKKHEKHAKLIWGIRFFVIIVLIMPIFSVAQDSWPQWRGPTRDGKVQNGQWLTSLDEKYLTALWRVRLGPSYSGPILSENMVFVTETQNKQYEVVRAFDRQNSLAQDHTVAILDKPGVLHLSLVKPLDIFCGR